MQVKQLMEKTEVESLFEAQRYIERRLEEKWLSKFTAAPDFIARQRPSVDIGHVVDDVMAAHRRRTDHALQRVSHRSLVIIIIIIIIPYSHIPCNPMFTFLLCFVRTDLATV